MAPDPKHLDDPFDTSDELMAEAAAMEARAAQRRQDSIDEVHRTMTPMAIDHNAEARAVKVAEHEASLARSDAKESREKAVKAIDDAAELTTKADSLEAAGDLAAAAELREDAAGAIEFAQRQTAQAAASEAAAVAADEQAKVHGARDQALLDAAPQHVNRGAAEEDGADQMERSAVLMRNAAAQMAEAERLDAAAADLRSRGVEGVERVDAAAKVARDEAEVLTLRAKQQDPTHSFGTEDNTGIDPDLIEIEPNTPAPADDLGIDPDLIEIEPNTPAPADDSGIDPDSIEIEPNTPAPAADSGIDPDLIEIEANASAEQSLGDDIAAADTTGTDFIADLSADSFAEDATEDPSGGSDFEA